MQLYQVLPFASPGPRGRSSLATSRPAQGLLLCLNETSPHLTLRRALPGTEAPRPGQGKALAPREPRKRRRRKRSGEGRGGRGSSEREAAPARGCGRGGVGWSGVCLRLSVRKSVGPLSPRAGVPCLQRQPATAIRTGAPCAREPRPLPGLLAGSSRSPRLAQRGAARFRQPGSPSPRQARAVPDSPCARALAPSRSGPIYEARSHHVLMSLCPALAAAAAQTPPRELRGEGLARGARGSKLCGREGTRRWRRPRGQRGRASLARVTYFSSSSSAAAAVPGGPTAMTWLSFQTLSHSGRAKKGLVPAPSLTSRP